MVRVDSQKVSGLKDILDFRKSYDVFLSCSFTTEEGHTDRYPFYDRVGSVIEGIGRSVCLPHKVIDQKWNPNKLYIVPNEIIIPTSDLVLCDLGVDSGETGIMFGSAIENSVPIIFLYERDSDFDSLRVNYIIRHIDSSKAISPKVKDFRRSIWEAGDPVDVSIDSWERVLESRLCDFYGIHGKLL